MSEAPIFEALMRLEAGQAQLAAGQERIDASLKALRVNLMARMDRLQNAVDSVREDLTVNYGASDRAERAARSAIDDNRALADIVRIMQRQIGKLRTDLDQLR